MQSINISYLPAILFFHTYYHSWIPSLIHILFSLVMPIPFKLYTHVYINTKTNVHEVLSWQSQMFDICKPYLLLHSNNPFSILCLTVIFFLQIPIKFLTVINKCFTLKLYTQVYIYKILMPLKCLVDCLKYLIFVSHICSFTSKTPPVILALAVIFVFCKCLWSFYCNS